jgi:hypothetical protein
MFACVNCKSDIANRWPDPSGYVLSDSQEPCPDCSQTNFAGFKLCLSCAGKKRTCQICGLSCESQAVAHYIREVERAQQNLDLQLRAARAKYEQAIAPIREPVLRYENELGQIAHLSELLMGRASNQVKGARRMQLAIEDGMKHVRRLQTEAHGMTDSPLHEYAVNMVADHAIAANMSASDAHDSLSSATATQKALHDAAWAMETERKKAAAEWFSPHRGLYDQSKREFAISEYLSKFCFEATLDLLFRNLVAELRYIRIVSQSASC